MEAPVLVALWCSLFPDGPLLHKVLEERLGVKKRKAKEVAAKEEQGGSKSAAPSVLTEVRHCHLQYTV